MKVFAGIVAGAACAAMVACGAAKRSSVMAQPPPAGGADAAMPMTASAAHDEIARLDQEITDELAKRSLPAPASPACASAGCGGASDAAVAMGVHPRVENDPKTRTCKPAASQTCTDSCTLSDSICKNAERICAIAKQLGDDDAYANEKCARGTETCQASQQRCCSCL